MKTSPRSRAWTKACAVDRAGPACRLRDLPADRAADTAATTLGYIQGTVRSTAGPEAGVWVIAETKDLPTGLIKIVVTDDQGRYVLPEYADGELQRLGPWLRPGDSKPVTAKTEHGQQCACIEPDGRCCQGRCGSGKSLSGQLLDAMLEPPAESAFPLGTGTIAADPRRLDAHLQVELQLLPSARQPDHPYAGSRVQGEARAQDFQEAWDYRLQTGVRGSGMSGAATSLNRPYRAENVRRLDGSHRQR